jgi:hypothetical protein
MTDRHQHYVAVTLVLPGSIVSSVSVNVKRLELTHNARISAISAMVGYVVAERFTARLTRLTHRPVTDVCAGCAFDPSSRH